MNEFTLKSPDEAEKDLAKVINLGLSEHDNFLLISCQDEGAFAEDARFPLGEIRLASIPDASADESEIAGLLRLGAYEWCTPKIDDANTQLSTALGNKKGENNSTIQLDTVLANIASIVVRIGFIWPTFDPAALEEMPYRRPTTVVVDTSGVLQGGLDFVAKFLHPAGRVKVPAIVNMEITNAAESYLSIRRSKKTDNPNKRKREVNDHLKSQGGQRALLRLELQTDSEVERTFLLGDPLREAFAPDNDGDVVGLNLSRPIGTYVDRLILEAARHHQAQTGPTHEVRLLTGDQGLARMALAEGIAPLYFNATKAEKFFGSRLSGRTLHPFTGRTLSIPLSTVLWEFATAFGEVKIENEKGNCSLTVCALGKDMSWSPYHSLDDLLWCSTVLPASNRAPSPQKIKKESSEKSPHGGEYKSVEKTNLTNETSVDVNQKIYTKDRRDSVKQNNRVAFSRFDVNRLFRLICALDDTQGLSVEDVIKVLGAKGKKGTDEYRRFLMSAGLIQVANGFWKVETGIATLSGALRNERTEEVHQCLLAAPSYNVFVRRVGQLGFGEVLDKAYFGRGINAYRILGEIGQICAEVRGEGIYSTATIMEIDQFAILARMRFTELETGSNLVSAGAWLESLIRKDGIHPVSARRGLNLASEKKLIRRSTEGSTTQIRNDDHVLHVLKVGSGMPQVEKIHLYRGDFLIPGKASVSLRILDAQP